MARPNELIAGNCYFMVGFHDQDLLFPYVSTLKYLRCEIEADGQRSWLFNDPAVLPHDEANSQGSEAVLGMPDEQLYQILDFPGLQRQLAAISIDHPLAPVPPAAMPMTGSLPADLKKNITDFLSDPQLASVTITIQFTDDGMSINRRKEGGTELMFFPHPRLDPAEESGIRSIFAELGIAPHDDYLSGRGRTRVLAYATPDNAEELSDLSARLLREVYAMRDHDTLKFNFRRSDTA